MTTNDDDHAPETKKLWSKLYELADAAAMVYDEEQWARKGKDKIVSEEEDEASKKKSFFDHVPRKIRSALRYPKPNFENLNGASTSSSSLLQLRRFEPSSSRLLLDYNISESKKTEMKDPPNTNYQSSQSSCLTDSTNPKRLVVSQRSRSRFKKPRVALFSRTPRWLIQVMRDMNGEDLRLICEKSLIVADVNPYKSRLSIPFNFLIRNDFLTPVESRIIEEDINKDEKIGVGAILVDQRTKIWGVILKRWDMKNGSWDYNFDVGFWSI